MSQPASDPSTASSELQDPTDSGWLRPRRGRSLSDVFGSIPAGRASDDKAGSSTGKTVRRIMAFMGPGFLVATGYMDPGNWATNIAGGSRFGYTLLFVTLLSSVMAMVLQALCARLAIASGRDLAQACRDAYPAWAAWPLWALAELAIIATDIAEVIGTAIGLNLLFGLPITIGIIITALDVFVVLALQRLGFRYLEAFVITLLLVIAVAFGLQLAMVKPVWGDLVGGFVPSPEIVTNPEMLYIALGIIGATVMPHNLYLHSAIVQTRDYGRSAADKASALKFATIDSTVALCFALLINASILIVAAGAFHANGRTDVAELGDAHALLSPLLGSALAPTLFGLALLACGLNSTVTATMAGQIVMEGFINFKVQPWVRRLITRAIAIIPAAGVTLIYGQNETAKLLIFSQVVLSLQLPFAMVPLLQFTMSRQKMGPLVAPVALGAAAVAIAALIIALNMKLLFDVAHGS